MRNTYLPSDLSPYAGTLLRQVELEQDSGLWPGTGEGEISGDLPKSKVRMKPDGHLVRRIREVPGL